MVEAAQWLNVSRFTLMRHVKSGKVLNGEYIIRLSCRRKIIIKVFNFGYRMTSYYMVLSA